MNKAEKFVIKDAAGNYLCAQCVGFEKWCDWSTDLGEATLFNKRMHAERAVQFYQANSKGLSAPVPPHDVCTVIIKEKVVETQHTLFGDES